MRDYGKVHTRFWSSETTRNLSDMGRLLALYLITSPHSTISGVFPLPDGYVCEDMQWTAQQVREGFVELLREGFANRCETTKWVWVIKHLEWNPPENPNQRKAAVKVAHSVPDKVTWRPVFMRVCGPSIGIPDPLEAKPALTLVEPLPNQKQEQKQEQEPPTGVEGRKPPKPPAFAVPDWIPADPWKDFVDMRRAKGKRAPFTVAAAKGIVEDLAKLQAQGHDVAAVLKQSVTNGWSGVFEIKQGGGKDAANDWTRSAL